MKSNEIRPESPLNESNKKTNSTKNETSEKLAQANPVRQANPGRIEINNPRLIDIHDEALVSREPIQIINPTRDSNDYIKNNGEIIKPSIDNKIKINSSDQMEISGHQSIESLELTTSTQIVEIKENTTFNGDIDIVHANKVIIGENSILNGNLEITHSKILEIKKGAKITGHIEMTHSDNIVIEDNVMIESLKITHSHNLKIKDDVTIKNLKITHSKNYIQSDSAQINN